MIEKTLSRGGDAFAHRVRIGGGAQFYRIEICGGGGDFYGGRQIADFATGSHGCFAQGKTDAFVGVA